MAVVETSFSRTAFANLPDEKTLKLSKTVQDLFNFHKVRNNMKLCLVEDPAEKMKRGYWAVLKRCFYDHLFSSSNNNK